MTTLPPPPTKMTWRRDGYDVWCDEDGVHLSVTTRGFEMPEALMLVELYQQVLDHFRSGLPFGKPERPTRRELMTYPDGYVANRMQRAVNRAIKDEFADDTVAPF